MNAKVRMSSFVTIGALAYLLLDKLLDAVFGQGNELSTKIETFVIIVLLLVLVAKLFSDTRKLRADVDDLALELRIMKGDS
jgi:hypothetical protein